MSIVMQVHPADPRDIRWEIPYPVYRVYFWQQQRPQGQPSGWASDERHIEDADVDEVLNWARDNAAGRRFVVYARVVVGDPAEPGLVRLCGTVPLDEISVITSASLEDR